ncbi:hypothetical protein AB0F15_33185 [Amycolatopsis sp. NPDC026612]|uniref:hypothetical protein n=1 Tax=Amycolatopsis sp. NPDC026612 TaxID=3155466 RepID=UPI0033EBDED8
MDDPTGWRLQEGRLPQPQWRDAGLLVRSDTGVDRMLLSCYHLPALDENWSSVDRGVRLPGPKEGGVCPDNLVGYLNEPASVARSTARWRARAARGRGAARSPRSARSSARATASLNDPVRKIGKVSGLSYGVVARIDVTIGWTPGGCDYLRASAICAATDGVDQLPSAPPTLRSPVQRGPEVPSVAAKVLCANTFEPWSATTSPDGKPIEHHK